MERIPTYLVAAQDAFGYLYFSISIESDEDAIARVFEGDTLVTHSTLETLQIFVHGLNVPGRVLPKMPYLIVYPNE